MALALIHMLMAGQFERFLDPLIVMLSVPMALVSVVPALLLTGTTLNIQSVMGLVMLIGIVVNNAIVLVDAINLLRRERRMGIADAVMEAGRLRLSHPGAGGVRAPLRRGARLPSAVPGALQWLQRGHGWNAYERPGGSSLWAWVRSSGRPSYAEAQRALAGVAAALASGAPFTLSLTRLWVDATGRTRLLDFDAVRSSPGEDPGAFEPSGWCSFLRRLLSFTLEGPAAARSEGQGEASRFRSRSTRAPSSTGSPRGGAASPRRRFWPTSRSGPTGRCRSQRRDAALAVPAAATAFAALSIGITLMGTPFLAASVELERALARWREVSPEGGG
jgi:hypothetical protein